MRWLDGDTQFILENEDAFFAKGTLMDPIKAYRLMYTSRALDKKMVIMIRQGKSFFHIGAMGHEAIQVATGLHMKVNTDWLFPYYRDQALCLTLGMTPRECLLGFLGKGEDPSSGGRQMPQHYGHAAYNIPSSSSPTGSQYLQAVGCALASKLSGKKEVTVVCSGEGTTSQGDFHEALNWAAREALPVVFLIENNGYAISVPVNEQRAKGRVGNLAKGYEGLDLIEVDGCDFEKSQLAMKGAIERARKGFPSLVDASVVRLLPHSSSDDQKKYRSAEELAADEKRDPIAKMRDHLVKGKVLTKIQLEQLESSIDKEIMQLADDAEAAPAPESKTAVFYVDSGKPEPDAPQMNVRDDAPEFVLVDAINRALDEEMRVNDKVLVFGQDVAKGKGGVFTATRELTKKHGDSRCFNAPLAESSIVGVAIGLALRGYKPIAEIQFGDYIWTGMNQIRNELVTMRYRSNNMFSAPAVLRVPVGGYIHGGLCHSQNIEATFSHFPGLKIALPSNALDAYGLLKTAARGQDPVLFLEHKALYRQNFAKSRLPDDVNFMLPFGKGRVVRAGNDVTVVTYGALVYRALEAARVLDSEGVSVEVLDLCSIRPLDFDLIRQSLKKTSRAIVLYEDNKFMGFGAEIAAQIAESCFELLDAPIVRVAGADSPIPYAPQLEEVVLPQMKWIVEAAKELVRY